MRKYIYLFIYFFYLRATNNDANERVLIRACSLHGGIEAPGKIELRVLGTPDCRTPPPHTHKEGVTTGTDIPKAFQRRYILPSAHPG